ncbi:MAG: dihydrodipicolinate reductase [Pseudomonadota bacterium]|nr:MAG: dihydrodipicolinate reductase [Pseudomonadota bacterium]
MNPERERPRSSELVPVVLVGLDEEARGIARALALHPGIQLVAVVDRSLAGRPLRSLLPEAPEGLRVDARPQDAFRRMRGGVAVLARGRSLEEIERDLFAAVSAGLSVVGVCEELVLPEFVDPEFAERIDEAAASRGVAVVGVGLVAGFLFDRLAGTLAQACGRIRRVEALRVVDLRGRPSLARRAGLGLSAEEFDRGVDQGRVGQPGLSEACGLLAESLGLELDEVEESVDPILADEPVEVDGERLERGRVLGLSQVALGLAEGRQLVRLEVELRAGADPRDEIRVEGDPPLRLVMPGGVPEEALGWVVANAALRVAAAGPGLVHVLDLPLSH